MFGWFRKKKKADLQLASAPASSIDAMRAAPSVEQTNVEVQENSAAADQVARYEEGAGYPSSEPLSSPQLAEEPIEEMDADAQLEALEASSVAPPVESTTKRFKGRVMHFDEDKGYGFIKVVAEGNEGAGDIYVHISQVADGMHLIKGETVDLSIIPGAKGRTQASDVRRTVPRYRGKVKTWLGDKKFGFISTDALDKDVFVHFRDIAAEGPRELEEGEDVEFSVQEAEEGPRATNVRVFQSRHPLERFALIDKFRTGPLLDRLAEMAPEDWNYRRSQSDRKHPVLYSYIMYTLPASWKRAR